MRKLGLAIVVGTSTILTTLLATQAQAVTLGVRTELRAAMATVDATEPIFDYGCCPRNCGCWHPHDGYYRRRYPPRYYYSDGYHERPHRYYNPGPFHEPEELNWGYRTRWAEGYGQY
jgi:hypothetical protein